MGYKLVYFNSKGRAEVCRLIFAYAGVEYEDIRLDDTQWAEHKSGLYGSNDIESAYIDMVIDCCGDMCTPLIAAIFNTKSDVEKEDALKKYADDFPSFCAKFEKLLNNNGGGSYLLGEKLTWADIQLTHSLTGPQLVGLKPTPDKYPKLCALTIAVESEPKIAEWIAKRPKTDH